jgi:hypothetical protein
LLLREVDLLGGGWRQIHRVLFALDLAFAIVPVPIVIVIAFVLVLIVPR